MDSFQMGRSGVSRVSSASLVGVNSMTKSAKTCPLIMFFGLYLMSNSLNSKAHFINLLEVSRLCSTCFIGYLMNTHLSDNYNRI